MNDPTTTPDRSVPADREPHGEPPELVVDFYWRPGCAFCMMLKRSLKRSKLPVREHNIWSDERAALEVRNAAGGNETVPTVGIGGHMLVNPPMKLVAELYERVSSGEIDRKD